MKKFATEPFVLRMTAKEIKDGLVAAHRAGDWETAKAIQPVQTGCKEAQPPSLFVVWSGRQQEQRSMWPMLPAASLSFSRSSRMTDTQAKLVGLMSIRGSTRLCPVCVNFPYLEYGEIDYGGSGMVATTYRYVCCTFGSGIWGNVFAARAMWNSQVSMAIQFPNMRHLMAG